LGLTGLSIAWHDAQLEFDYLPWWAYSFSLAVIIVATFIMLGLTELIALAIIGWVLLSIVTTIAVFLLCRGAVAIDRRAIRVPHL